MIQSAESLATLLRGTPLEGRPVREMWSCSGVDPILVIEIEGSHDIDDLALLSSLIERTGRYPVISNKEYLELMFLDTPPSKSDMANGDWVEKTSAKALLVDAAQYLATGGYLSEFSPTRTNHIFGWLDMPLDHWAHPISEIFKRFGAAPSIQQIRDLQNSGKVRTDAELERWLFEWELTHFGDAALLAPSVEYLDGVELTDGYPRVVVLLPTLHSWKSLLYMGWYGLGDAEAEQAAALRVWGERYGVELIGSFSTTLHLTVKRRPQSVDEAFALALEHRHFASDTLLLPGISTRDHARALLSLDRWYFHSRP